MRRFLARALAAVLLVHAATAFADDEEEARAAMRRGAAAFGRGDVEGALTEYETAKRLAPSANAPYLYVGEALAQLGRWREAVENLEGYLAKNPDVSDAPQVRERIMKIRAEHFPGRVAVEVDPPSAIVLIDETERGPPATFSLAPGKHRIEARAPHHDAIVQEIIVQGDSAVPLVFVLPPTKPPPSTPRVEAPPPVVMEPSPWRTVGWITAGVGVASVATTFVVDAAVLGPKIADYRAAADRGDESARGLRSDVEDLRKGVLIGYVAGGTLALAGITLAIFAPPQRRIGVVPWVGSGLAGIGANCAF